MKALLLDNKVIQVELDEFPIAPPLEWVDCPITTKVGYTYDNGNFISNETNTEPTLAEAKAQKLAELAAYRYQKEVGGLTVNGYLIATDDRSKTLLLGARMLADTAIANNITFSVDWKTENGFESISATTIVALSNAMSQFVQHCFSVEASHAAMINSLTTVASVQSYSFLSGW